VRICNRIVDRLSPGISREPNPLFMSPNKSFVSLRIVERYEIRKVVHVAERSWVLPSVEQSKIDTMCQYSGGNR